jgi:hypothetical protein
MMEAVSTSENSVNIYQTTRCNIPGDSYLEEIYFGWYISREEPTGDTTFLHERITLV